MTEDPDVALTVALAEYEHLRDARRTNHDQSTARFNFFLIVASAATAVAGGLISGGGSGAANTSAVIGIGALVLLLGLSVFVRQVEFTNRARLYAVAIDSVRTYLARRAPQVAPYMIMPTLDHPGVYQGRPPGGQWLHDVIGMAGTVGLVNSALIAVGAGVSVRRAGAAAWLAALCGVAALAALVTAHTWYVNRRTASSFARIRNSVDQRLPLDGTAPAPRPAPGASGGPDGPSGPGGPGGPDGPGGPVDLTEAAEDRWAPYRGGGTSAA